MKPEVLPPATVVPVATPPRPWHSGSTTLRSLLACLTAAALAQPPLAHAAQPPPHRIAAANLQVIQNDTGNTVNSVTVNATLSINDLRVRTGSNRGDFNFQVGDDGADDLTNGLPMVAISENGRDNGELPDEQPNYAAPAFDGGTSGYWAVVQDLTSSRAEVNMNCAVGFFRYTDWLCGWARNATAVNGATNNLLTASPGLILGTHFRGISNGRSRVDLTAFGIYSTNSGVLLVNHAKNEGNYATAQVNATGTWEIWCKDNFGNGSSLEQDPVAFVFIPKTNTLVVSGRFGLDATGTNAVILLHSGATPEFAVTNFAPGRYRLTIPTGAPGAGVLLVSSETSGTSASGFDNTVSYQADGNSWIIEHRDVNPFPPQLEAATNQPVASFVYIPAATAGVAVTPTNTLVTTEFGLTASFSVELDLAPTNDVTLTFSSSNPAEGVLSTNSLTFNATNWNVPQIVTLTGQDDAVADGNQPYTIVFAPVVSGDTRYAVLTVPALNAVNVDDETFGITVTPTNGLSTTEAGGIATFNVFLNRAPASDVTVGLTSATPGEASVAPASLTFTPANWSTPQTVTVTGVDDFRVDGARPFVLVTAPAVSADPNYAGLDAANVTGLNLDNDTPAILYGALSVAVSEGGSTNYSVVLATEPDTNVTITVTTSDPAVATVTPGVLTFTPANWNIPQVVTVFGTDNLIVNGSTTFLITNLVASADPLYADFAGARLISGLRLDNETSFVLPSGDNFFGLGMPPIGLDGQARVEDVDAVNFNGGSLTVALATNGAAADILGIRSTGSGPGQIAVSGPVVSYGGVTIGTWTGGTGLAPLVITLNTNATVPAVQQLARNLTFSTPSAGASLASRSVRLTLDDGLGGPVEALKLVHVGALRLTQYQEGGDNGYGEYFGAGDIALSEVGANQPWPIGRNATEGLLMDWPDGGTPNESQVLLRFDDFVGTNFWQVPSNATVVAAELLINVNNTGDGARFHRMLIPWDADNDTWNSLGDGVQQDDVESRSVYESQLGVEDGSGATGVGLISVGVTADVQAWVNGETNHGWVMKGWPLRTDGTAFSPSEAPNVWLRPRLRVFWLPAAHATASFQQGVGGYTGTQDANLQQHNPDLNFATAASIGVDFADAGGTNTTQGLVWFQDIIGTGANQVPPGALIHAAVLELFSTGPDAMGDGGAFHALLQPWNPATTTWNTWLDGVQADGIEAAITPTAVAGDPSLNPDVQGTLNSFLVTSDVQAWASGFRTNYGWAILPWPGGANGWFSRSSDFNSLVNPLKPEAERPRLRVYYTPGAVAAPAVLQPPVPGPGVVQVLFTGTANMTYTVQRAAAATGPWFPLGTATVATNGTATFPDNAPLPGTAFYRVVYP